MGERVLIVGSGAREHALAHKLSCGEGNQTDRTRQIFVLGGNAGLGRDFECVEPKRAGIMGMVEAAQRIAPSLVVIGPESHLAAGLVDAFYSHGIRAFGPSMKAAQLEASKAFSKKVCNKAQVPTARHEHFKDLRSARLFVSRNPHDEMVIKVDGLCAGKGVTVCHSKEEAISTLTGLFDRDGFARLGVKDQAIIIEEYLCGSEVSVFGVADGADVALFCPMQDYKRLLDLDQGPNTGGMGAVGPLGEDRAHRASFLQKVKEQFFLPVLKEMAREGIRFSGLLYAGLMLTEKGPHLLEFNVRFGDPETQALMLGTRADIYPLLYGIAYAEPLDMAFWQDELLDMEPAISIVLAGAGYPFEGVSREPISLPKQAFDGTKLFFAATAIDEAQNLLAGTGRVVNVVARGSTIEEARALGYGLVREIKFLGMQYRSDIGTNVTNLNHS